MKEVHPYWSAFYALLIWFRFTYEARVKGSSKSAPPMVRHHVEREYILCHNLYLFVSIKFSKRHKRVKQETNTRLCGASTNLSLFQPLYLIQSRKLFSSLKLNPDSKSESKEWKIVWHWNERYSVETRLLLSSLPLHPCRLHPFFCMSIFELDLIFMYSWDECFILFPPLLLRWLYLFRFSFLFQDEKSINSHFASSTRFLYLWRKMKEMWKYYSDFNDSECFASSSDSHENWALSCKRWLEQKKKLAQQKKNNELVSLTIVSREHDKFRYFSEFLISNLAFNLKFYDGKGSNIISIRVKNLCSICYEIHEDLIFFWWMQFLPEFSPRVASALRFLHAWMSHFRHDVKL
jgi:hypothetical protein